MLVGADVVRLHRRAVALQRRHVAADLLRMERIADIHRAQSRVEVGEEHDVLPRPVGRQMLQDVVGAVAAGAVKIFLAVRHEGRDRYELVLLAGVDHPHELCVPVFLLGAGFVGADQIRPVAERPAGVVGAGERRCPRQMPDQFHVAEVRAVDHRDAAAPPRAIHPVAADHRRAVQRHRLLMRRGVAGFAIALRLHPGQAPLAEDLRLGRVLDVERPDHPLVPARRVVRQERELALVIDAEAVRAGAGRVVEADLFRLAALRDVEDEQAGAGVAAGLAAEPLGVHVENIAVDHAELVRMHAGRRLHLGDLLRLPRVAHVVDGETFGAVVARVADRADIGKALVDLDDRAAAPGGG